MSSFNLKINGQFTLSVSPSCEVRNEEGEQLIIYKEGYKPLSGPPDVDAANQLLSITAKDGESSYTLSEGS